MTLCVMIFPDFVVAVTKYTPLTSFLTLKDFPAVKV